MITIEKLIRVSGEAPYEVYVNTSGQSSVDQISDDIFKITIIYSDEVGTGDTVTVTDALGCIRSLPLQITDPCQTYFVSEIIKVSGGGNPPQTFTSTPSVFRIDSNQDVDIQWSLDDPELYITTEQGNQITLNQINQGTNITQLRATVTNLNGCIETRRYQLAPCLTSAQDSERILYLREDDTYTANAVPMFASTSCTPGIPVDWSTAQITSPANLTVTQRPGQPLLDIVSLTSIPTQYIYFSVADTTGQRSNIARIKLTSSDTLPLLTTGQSTELGFEIPNVFVGSGINTVTIPINELGIPSGINGLAINNTLTTANSAAINNNILSADITGQAVATVGFNSTGNQPSVLAIIRQLDTYDPVDFPLYVGCGSIIYDVSNRTDIDSVTELISGEAVLNGNSITLSEDDQIVTLKVEQEGQIGTVDIYACKTCGGDEVIKTTCETTYNLYDQLVAPTGGTWVTTTGSPIPTTYNSSVTLSDGIHSYTYQVTNPVTQCLQPIEYTLTVTKEAATQVSNDSCAGARVIPSVTEDQIILSSGTINSSCVNQTTWSTNVGNKIDHLYDQWFTFDSNTATIGQTVTLEVKITGSNGLIVPDVQLWNTCAAPTTGVTYNQTTNTATAVYTFNSGTNRNFIGQVLSDTTGNYTIQITQTVV